MNQLYCFFLKYTIMSNMYAKKLANYAVFITYILSRFMSRSHAQNSDIKPGQVLRFPDKLVSPGGVFTLGFFNPTNSDYWYLGIWYSNDVYDMKVWIGNRLNPLMSVEKGNLTLDADGILKIMNADTVVMINSVDTAVKNSSATLDDSGNLVLSHVGSSTKRVLWESFNHPTDTLLPGMKLGENFKTGQKWSLTSWLSDKAAAPGAFSLEWDWKNTQLVMIRRGEIYWTSGKLEKQNTSFPNMIGLDDPFNSDYIFYNIDNDGEGSYFYYSITTKDRVSWWSLRPDGSIFDTDRVYLVNGDACYGYRPGASGCTDEKLATCRAVAAGGTADRFVKQFGSFGRNPVVWYDHNWSIGASDCWATCWNNCSCIAYNTNAGNGTGCIFWGSGSIYEQSVNTMQMYVLNSTLSNGGNGKNSGSGWWKWLLIAMAINLAFVFLGWLFYLRRKKRKENQKRFEEEMLYELTTSDGFDDFREIANDGNNGREVKLFSFTSILAATNNFSPDNKLGEGGFGPVYMGVSSDGQKIAVKRLSRGSGQGLLEFKNEIVLIAKLQHMNLVRLLGCCIQGDQEKMLVYEYMHNKSLDFFLFNPDRKAELDWKRRYKIIEGIAQGLLYLHKYSRLRIIHRDLKVSNILLDDEMNPKISDFGMARIFGRNDTEANTNRVVGTYGYMSPEYAMEGIFSEKSDIFSFGVLMLEIISGRKNSSFYFHDAHISLVAYVWELWNERTLTDIVDSSMKDFDRHQILRCIQVGLLCVQEKAGDRPTTSEVLSFLSNETMTLPAPNEPSFVSQKHAIEIVTVSDKPSNVSVNNISSTVLAPR